MLETFRKYTGLMFVVLILLFVGLVFFGSSQQSMFSGPKVAEAFGKGYSQPEFNRMVVKPARMLRELAGLGPRYQLIDPYLRRMGVVTYAGFPLNDEQLMSYLVNRLSFQRAMREFGVAASTAEVEQFLREEIFWENEAFDAQAYQEFKEKTLDPLGMTEKGMYDVMGEIIALRKLEDLLGSGVGASEEVVTSNYLAGSQQVSYQLMSFPVSDFEEGIELSEEEIKTYWEENKADYLSEPKRAVTYILARPDYAALEEEKKAASNGTDEGSDDEQPEEPEGADETASDTTLTEDERSRAVIELGAKLDTLDDRLRESNGEGLEELVKEPAFNFELKSTELVAKEELPAELQGALRNARGKTGADVIFEHQLGETTYDAFGEIKRMGTDQWLLYRIDEVVEPEQLTLEGARERVRNDLLSRKAAVAMEETANEKHQALEEALASGKDFAAAAEEVGLDPIAKVNIQRPPGREPSPVATEFALATKTNPGELSEVQTEENEELGINRALFVHVDRREVYEDPNLESILTTRLESVRERNRGMVIDNWLTQQAADANLQTLNPVIP